MISQDQINELSQRIVDQFHPEKIVLFGSYAGGEPNADSDVDLLVVLSFEGRLIYKAMEIRLGIRADFPLDLIVRTPVQIQERLAMGDTFIRSILRDGVVLYDTVH